MHSIIYNIIASIFAFFKEILYFPVWWYTAGSLSLVKGLFGFLKNKAKYFALVVWVKNIFKPIYSRYDFVGIIISFFIRSFQIIFRATIMLGLIFLSCGVFLLWLAIPVIIGIGIFYQF